MILTNQLKPGEKLASIEELASRFQVGRSAIREALTFLKAMGLVEMRQGEGTYVREYNPATLLQHIPFSIFKDKEELLDLIEVRKIIEVGTASLAARNWRNDDLKQIELALEQMKRNIGDEEKSEKADLDFHLGIARASHNRLLIQLMDTISSTMVKQMKESRKAWLFREEASAERLLSEHAEILAAIRDRNAEKAEKLMRKHLTQVQETIAKNFEDD